jgi:hypothetical protein
VPGRCGHALDGDVSHEAKSSVRRTCDVSTRWPSSARFGISRKTGYKWIARYREEGGAEGLKVTLADRSRRPHTSPRATEVWLEDTIVTARKQRPHWGPKKLRAVLARRNPDEPLPAESTFATIFKRNGLVRPRRRRQRTPPYTAPFGKVTGANGLLCVDFKGQFAVGKAQCYPLTVTDAHSQLSHRVRRSRGHAWHTGPAGLRSLPQALQR